MADFDRPGYDDYDDREISNRYGDRAPVNFPGTLMAAGVIYIICGALFLLNAAGSCFLSGVGGGNRGANFCGVVLSLILGVPYLLGGITHVRKSTVDPIAYAIMSLVVGAIYLLLGVLIAVFLIGQFPEPALGVFMGIFMAIFAVILALPGVLALVSRKKFLIWRREQFRQRLNSRDDYDDAQFNFDSPRGRPRRDESDDYFDEGRPGRYKE